MKYAGFINTTLLFFYPFLILSIFGLFCSLEWFIYSKEILEFGLFTFVLYSIYLILPNGKSKSYIFYGFYLLLLLIAFIKLAIYYNFNSQLNSSVLYIAFETNSSETFEFLNTYVDIYVVLFLLILSIPLLTMLFIKKSRKVLQHIPIAKRLKLVLLFAIIVSSAFIHTYLKDENLLLNTIYSFNEFKKSKALFKNTIAKKQTPNVTEVNSTELPQTYVVIIGESTTKHHMQLYGYPRTTNPLLKQMNDELFIFKDVISPNVHTISALDKIFTLSNYQNNQVRNNASIIQLANNAGFTTYWLSSQKPIGIHESLPSLLGNSTDQAIYINTKDYMETFHDGEILPYLDNILEETIEKKIIFIHLMGTHIDYKKRYPEDFNKFTDKEHIISVNQSTKALQTINEYDNAVLYNDYIVTSIIEKVKKKELNSFVLYFSDHGDEIYDTIDFVGHHESKGTKSMYEVPFILWLSEKYKVENPEYTYFQEFLNRPYNLEDFFYSFSDLCNIEFSEHQPENSIFNSSFLPKKRIIKNGIDYDDQ